MAEEVFTKARLAEFDGKNGRPAYVAHQGKVYDVTESVLWESGEHEGEHAAGADLTAEMDEAPHFPEELGAFPIVGTFEE